MAAPAWAPTLQAVAVHIPTRTREVGNVESNDYALTFNANTTPTDAEVLLLIGKGCTVGGGAIVLGHVVGVAVAHAMLADVALPKARLLKLELPLALCMVAYMGFGLWLLAAPAIT